MTITYVYRTNGLMVDGVRKLCETGAHLRDMQILQEGCGGWIVLVDNIEDSSDLMLGRPGRRKSEDWYEGEE